MSDPILNNVSDKPESTNLLSRIWLSVLFLACSLAIFLLGANYYRLFPTNGSWVYAGSLAVFFLVVALLLRHSVKLAKYWPIFYAFFVASGVNLVSDLFAGYNSQFVQLFGTWTGTNQGFALAKLYDALLVVIPILALTLISGENLDSLFLKKGNLNWKWGLGIGTLVLMNFMTSSLIFFGTGYDISKLGAAIVWGIVFSLSNSMLEELWIRGLFLKKLVPLIGVAWTVVLSSVWFASLHFLAVAYLPAMVIPVFVVNTFTLGLACAILMIKTDSIWGAFLIHAAADLFLFIAILAVH